MLVEVQAVVLDSASGEHGQHGEGHPDDDAHPQVEVDATRVQQWVHHPVKERQQQDEEDDVKQAQPCRRDLMGVTPPPLVSYVVKFSSVYILISCVCQISKHTGL